MQKPQNISVLKSDPDLEPPTILFDSISIEFLSPLSRKLPRRAKHNSYPRIPIHRVLTEPELRNISPRNSSRIPLIRWSRSRVSIGIVHRWFISMLGARAPATQDRRFSPLPLPPGVVTRLPIFTVTQSQWILFLTFGQMSCETIRQSCFFVFQTLYPRTRALRHLFIHY